MTGPRASADSLLDCIQTRIELNWQALLNTVGWSQQAELENPSISNAGSMPWYLKQTLSPLISRVASTRDQAILAVDLLFERFRRRSVESTVTDFHAYDFGNPLTIVLFDAQPVVELATDSPKLADLIYRYSAPLIGELPHGRHIGLVVVEFSRLLHDISVCPADLWRLSARQFEEFVAGLWEKLGYDVELTRQTRDDGRDVIAVRKAEAAVKFLIECKRFESSRKVGVSLVRALYGVKCDEGATKAILATTSSFTPGALQLFNRHRWELEPRDFDGIMLWVANAIKVAGP